MGIVVNWVDVAVVILLLVGASIGLFQGLVRQTVFVITCYVAVVLAAQYHLLVASILASFFPNGQQTIISLTALGIVFVVACVGLNILTYTLYHTSAVPAIATIDHLGGALLGTVATWVILSFTLGIIYFGLAIPWTGWEGVQHDMDLALRTSLFRQSLHATLPMLSDAIKPWFPNGLPAILFT